MLTVERLLADCALEIAAGAAGAGRAIRWVHITELEDPTPWLSGDELLLTTGIQLQGAAQERTFVQRVAEKGVAGLGLGTGFTHKRIPKPLRDEADQRGLPLFEVPYEMPFIAITEKAFATLVNEQYDVLARSASVHERLERLVVEGRGLDEVLREVASTVGGSALVHDGAGHQVARYPNKGLAAGVQKQVGAEVAHRSASTSVEPFTPTGGGLGDRALSFPVPAGRGGSGRAWLTVVTEREEIGE